MEAMLQSGDCNWQVEMVGSDDADKVDGVCRLLSFSIISS